MLVVADSSALIALAVCDALPFLDRLFRDVRIPPAVFRECVAAGKHSADLLKVYLREKVVEVDLAAFAIAAVDLGRGELEAIALCKRIAADRLLVDDRRARQIAVLNDIEVVGSLGVLLAAKRNGLLNDIESRIETMRSAGIRLGPGLVAEALRLAGEPK